MRLPSFKSLFRRCHYSYSTWREHKHLYSADPLYRLSRLYNQTKGIKGVILSTKEIRKLFPDLEHPYLLNQFVSKGGKITHIVSENYMLNVLTKKEL